MDSRYTGAKTGVGGGTPQRVGTLGGGPQQSVPQGQHGGGAAPPGFGGMDFKRTQLAASAFGSRQQQQQQQQQSQQMQPPGIPQNFQGPRGLQAGSYGGNADYSFRGSQWARNNRQAYGNEPSQPLLPQQHPQGNQSQPSNLFKAFAAQRQQLLFTQQQQQHHHQQQQQQSQQNYMSLTQSASTTLAPPSSRLAGQPQSRKLSGVPDNLSSSVAAAASGHPPSQWQHNSASSGGTFALTLRAGGAGQYPGYPSGRRRLGDEALSTSGDRQAADLSPPADEELLSLLKSAGVPEPIDSRLTRSHLVRGAIDGTLVAFNAAFDPTSCSELELLKGETLRAQLRARCEYGLLGMLKIIRMRHRGLNNLALGMDLRTLNFAASEFRSLTASFTSPWESESDAAALPDFKAPACHQLSCETLVNSATLTKAHESTLLYIFYNLPNDMAQPHAAIALIKRGWYYLPREQLWMIKSSSQSNATGCEWEMFDPVEFSRVPYEEEIDVKELHEATDNFKGLPRRLFAISAQGVSRRGSGTDERAGSDTTHEAAAAS